MKLVIFGILLILGVGIDQVKADAKTDIARKTFDDFIAVVKGMFDVFGMKFNLDSIKEQVCLQCNTCCTLIEEIQKVQTLMEMLPGGSGGFLKKFISKRSNPTHPTIIPKALQE